MESVAPHRSLVTTVVAVLAAAQGVFGILRAVHWFEAGSDLLGQGLLLVPLVGAIAFLRGAFVATIALMYVIFACGIFLHKGWTWWVGLVVAVVNLLLMLSILAQGEESLARAIPWAIVPIIVLIYLLAPAGRRATAN
jgi:hypothetical protein